MKTYKGNEAVAHLTVADGERVFVHGYEGTLRRYSHPTLPAIYTVVKDDAEKGFGFDEVNVTEVTDCDNGLIVVALKGQSYAIDSELTGKLLTSGDLIGKEVLVDSIPLCDTGYRAGTLWREKEHFMFGLYDGRMPITYIHQKEIIGVSVDTETKRPVIHIM